MTLGFELSGEDSRIAERFTADSRNAKGLHGYKQLGETVHQAFGPQWVPVAPEGTRWFYASKSSRLRADHHPEGLLPVDRFDEGVLRVKSDLAVAGLTSLFEPRLVRIDLAADVLFASSLHGRSVFEAFASMRPSGMRRLSRPYESTLYLHSSDSPRPSRLGRIYDKGQERRAKAGWRDIEDWRYLRFEVEQTYTAGQRVPVSVVTSEWARAMFMDRFGDAPSVGHLPSTGGAQMRVEELMQREGVSIAKGLRLIGFLTMEQSGTANSILGHRKAQELRLECRKLGLASTSSSSLDPVDAAEEIRIGDMLDALAAGY